jgi:hypothetical protein
MKGAVDAGPIDNAAVARSRARERKSGSRQTCCGGSKRRLAAARSVAMGNRAGRSRTKDRAIITERRVLLMLRRNGSRDERAAAKTRSTA